MSGPFSGGAWIGDEKNPLAPASIVTRQVSVTRAKNALKPALDDFLFFLIQTKGRQHIRHHRRSLTLSPGDLTIFNGRDTCEMIAPTASEVQVMSLGRGILKDTDLFDSLAFKRLPGQTMRVRILAEILRMLATSPGSALIAEDSAYIEDLLRAAIRGLDDEHKVVLSSSRQPTLEDIEKFARQHLNEPDLGPIRIASVFGLSLRSLYRLFAAQQVTPSNWVWSLRLDEAERRLVSRDWAPQTVTDIAYSVGFNDSAHFSRTFARTYGMTPSRYRRERLPFLT
ncbi:helix-turn-helix domain-containing protein [Maritimibacter sp. DP1N21-5]|nr:helix-turn-helix domain-containing protein [Maritimibacter sp. DP1N21-5]MBV7407471.1 helix-turn-helix domain-containing protein [Maritimibacter sp. DP1N21-5]